MCFGIFQSQKLLIKNKIYFGLQNLNFNRPIVLTKQVLTVNITLHSYKMFRGIITNCLQTYLPRKKELFITRLSSMVSGSFKEIFILYICEQFNLFSIISYIYSFKNATSEL